jgi:hypothetical protein
MEGQMATRIVKVTGIAEWAKVFADNRDLTGWKASPQVEGTYEKYDGACTIDLILDDESVAKLQAAKCAKGFKADSLGRGQRVKFDRKFNTGHDWSSGAPIVTKEDGSKWTLDEDGPIGTRLEHVHVIDHLQYLPPQEFIQPQDSGDSPPAPKKKPKEVLEDEILF